MHDGLIETDFGEWERLTFAEAADARPGAARPLAGRPVGAARPDGESFDAGAPPGRAGPATTWSPAYGGGTVVVVSHVTPIKSLLRMGLDAGPSLLFRLHLDLASLSIVEFYPDGNASVRLVNDTSHLRHEILYPCGRVGRAAAAGETRRGKSGLRRAGWLLTATRGDPRDSATENRPPGGASRGKGETVV